MKIDQTLEIAAPPETVFRALTDADELSRWWTTTADSVTRPGGAFEYRFEFDEQPERNHTYSGTYEEFVPNKRVAYPWQASVGDTRVDVTLRPTGDGTTLCLVHTGWGDDDKAREAVQMHEEGWGFFLGNLKSYLERGDDQRAAAMGMKTRAVTT